MAKALILRLEAPCVLDLSLNPVSQIDQVRLDLRVLLSLLFLSLRLHLFLLLTLDVDQHFPYIVNVMHTVLFEVREEEPVLVRLVHVLSQLLLSQLQSVELSLELSLLFT